MAYVLTSEFLNEEDLMSLLANRLPNESKATLINNSRQNRCREFKDLGVERQRLGLWKPIGRSKFRFSKLLEILHLNSVESKIGIWE
ncbi:1100_t:CDS:2 [Funneliformis mosseae]|uniref:1100_t:CDS:1 n=1 Tax=Funneliformis mosseae TaxID=27381 RepID=A0A9N8W337_FUNMO|nr:1100_t:CDS:2 [Funneliformis mosseae]